MLLERIRWSMMTALVCGLFAPTAWGQESGKPPPTKTEAAVPKVSEGKAADPEKGQAASSAAAVVKKGPRAITFTKAFKIEGTIQKPQAFYILQRSSLNFGSLELKNSFLPKVINSVDQPPF